MGLVSGALSVFAANLVGSALPSKIAIGTSGLAFDSGQSTLGIESDRNLIVDSDLTVTNQVTLISNFSAVEVSGTVLREFGTFTSGGEMLDRQVLTGSLVFDGEQELQVQETFTFFISGT